MENLVTFSFKPSRDFWASKDVFVTGHTGFKGGWLSNVLVALGAKVHGFALKPEPRGVFEATKVEARLANSLEGDVRDLAAVEAALQRTRPKVVFHLAAQPLVLVSYANPIETYVTNVIGTVHLLDAIRRCSSVEAVVVVTSDKCYENKEWFWGYRESEPMGGYDPYSNSKGCAELVTAAYRNSFFGGDSGTKIASARAGNVIGGGDWAQDRLVPDLISHAKAGVATLIRNPVSIRPWQHVLEPLLGYIALAEALCGPKGENFTEGWNFGPSSEAERTTGDVANTVCELWGGETTWCEDDREHAHEARFLKLDSSKARTKLAWTPRWNFHETLRQTVRWYQADANGENMADFTTGQIETYFGTTGDIR